VADVSVFGSAFPKRVTMNFADGSHADLQCWRGHPSVRSFKTKNNAGSPL
jgi:hypothetical protein